MKALTIFRVSGLIMSFSLAVVKCSTYTRLAFFGVVLFLGDYSICFSQKVKLAQITPQSPNIASLEKFTDVPVGLGTGMVNVQVPLYEIKVGTLTIPIILSHNNNGLKTDEIPSWVGHGWSLSTGGYISYQQNGLNDFDQLKGLFPFGLTKLSQYYGNQMSSSQKRDYFEDIIAGNIDAEHDEYSYNFIGNTGTFHFLSANVSRTNPKTDLKITKTLLGFEIIDDSGNTFLFEAAESITREDPESYDGNFSDNSAYYISKIVTADNKEVFFSYKSYFLQYTNHMTSLGFSEARCTGYAGLSVSSVLTKINYMLPDEIIFPSGKLKFNHSNAVRADLLQINAASNARHLTGITVYNKNDEKIKDFSFDMAYFGTNVRLKLNSVSETNNDDIVKKWQFDYYDGFGHPPIFSKSKDHWGYYNGSSSTNNLPKANWSEYIGNYNNTIEPDAEKNSDFNYSKAGMLKSIKYPTGGKSEFEYEKNKIFFSDFSTFPLQLFPPQNSSEYSEAIAGADAYTGNSVSGSFTIVTPGIYYLQAYKILSPDYMYLDADVIFSGSNSNSVNRLNSSLMNGCDFTLGQCTFGGPVLLEAGVYTFSVNGSYYVPSDGQSTYYLHAGFSLKGMPQFSAFDFAIGGGRIAKVISSEMTNAIPLVKRYIYDDSSQKVSFKSIPNYTTTQEVGVVGNGGEALYCLYCRLDKIWEESVTPMVGPVIEYGMVTELTDGLADVGKTERYFSFSENRGGNFTPPIVVPKNTSWSGGLLLKEKIFEKNFTVPKKENTVSYSSGYLSSQVNGLKVGYNLFCPINSESTRSYYVSPTTVYSEDFKKIASLSKLNEGNLFIQSKDTITYSPLRHNSPSNMTRTTSNEQDIIKKVKYVFDFDNLSASMDDPSKGLKRLWELNMNYPVEELEIRMIDGIEFVTQGILRTFKAGQAVPDEIYELELLQPVTLSSFSLSTVGSSGIYNRDSRYTLKVKFDDYDTTNFNLKQQHVANGTNFCYLYSYNHQYPIAEITNVDYTLIEAVLGGQATINSFSAANPSDAEIQVFLATLKNSPLLGDAHITTYTYKPLVGMTSMTDAKGMTVYYEYDGFGRLKGEKDHNGKVLKTYGYHYRGQ